MLLRELARFTDVALLLLRVMVWVVFVTSGWNHLREPEARSKGIEQSKGVTIFLGAAELAAGLGYASRSRSSRCHRFDPHHAEQDLEKDFRLAYRLLGQIGNKWLELRHHVYRHESRHSHHWRR
jgi:hypothetical protein